MKLNWGSGIAIIYSAFVVLMISMVVYSKGLDHSLVVDNYYEEDLKYQGHIDRVKNAQQLDEDLKIGRDVAAQAISFSFPNNFKKIEGYVWFYRADDKSKDFTVAIRLDENGQFRIPLDKVGSGKWTIKVNWAGDGVPYYKEESMLF